MRLLLYLSLTQLKNHARSALRSPKKLIPVLIMAMAFTPAILQNIYFSNQNIPMPSLVQVDSTLVAQIRLGLFALLVIITVFMIVKSFFGSMIAFNLADFDYLFPTPVSRRLVISMKLLAIYAKICLYSLCMTLFFIPNFFRIFIGSISPGKTLISCLAIMLFGAFMVNVCTTLNLMSVPRDGSKWWVAWAVRGVTYALLAFAIGDMVFGYLRNGSLLPAVSNTFVHIGYLLVFFPAKWTADLISIMAGSNIPGAAMEFTGLFILALASFAMVINRKENPYEPSLEISMQKAIIRQAIRSGGWLKVSTEMRRLRKAEKGNTAGIIPPFGRGAVALFWKNLNISVKVSGKPMVLFPLLVGVLLVVLKTQFPDIASPEGIKIIEGISFAGLCYIVYFFAISMVQTFRGDLKQANILKPMPIPSWQVVLVPVLNGVLLLSLLIWVSVILEVAIIGVSDHSPLIAAALCLPTIVCSLLAWQSVTAIMYPNWQDAGQRFIGGLVSMATMGLSIGPALAICFILWFLNVNIYIIFVCNTFVALGSAVGGIAVAAHLYRKFDPTDE